MSFTVTDAFVAQYSSNVRMLAQQMTTRFRPCVYEETLVGENLFLEYIAPTVARKRQSRHGDTPIMNTQHLRRRLAPYTYEWGDLIDKLDKVMMLIDPTSAYAQQAASALLRGVDDEIIAAMWATAYTGHAGGTSVVWPAGNAESTPTTPAGLQIAVNDWTYGNGSGNAGLTIAKLIQAKMALMAAEGDENEEMYIGVSSKQIGNLLATTEATSADYTQVQALARGTIDTFMGFKFIHSERLLLNGSSYRRVPAWRKSGVGLGVAADVAGEIAPRVDKSFATQVYASMAVGASRMEEAKLVEIICSEA